MELSKPPNAGIIGNSSSLTKPASRTATSIPGFNFQTEEAQSCLWAAQRGGYPLARISQGLVFLRGRKCHWQRQQPAVVDKIRARPQKETLLTYEKVKPATNTQKKNNNKLFHCDICVSWPQTGWQYESTGTPAVPAQLPCLPHALTAWRRGQGEPMLPWVSVNISTTAQGDGPILLISWTAAQPICWRPNQKPQQTKPPAAAAPDHASPKILIPSFLSSFLSDKDNCSYEYDQGKN